MDLSKISSAVLENLIKLTRKREAIREDLKRVEAELAGVYKGDTAAVTPKRRKGKAATPASKVVGGKSRGRRGALKDKVLAALRSAGDKGISVKDLSKKLGVKNQNVHVWFSSTGKNVSGIQKIGAGVYRLKPGV